METRTIAARDGEAVVRVVQGLVRARPDVVLDEELRAVTGVDAVVVVVEDVVEDVAVPEAERGRARVEVHPAVERERHLDRDVLRAVVVRVPDEGRLPVVVEVRVGDRDACAAVRDVEEAVVAVSRSASRRGYMPERDLLVLIVVTVAGEVAVVDPDV